MAKELAEFAGGGVVVHDQRWDPELSDDVIEFIETESDFRKFVKIVPTQSYVINLPRKWHAGIAVEVVEGSEIPKARDVYDAISINLRQNGTGIRMTDEEQDMMGFDANYFQTEAARASERLLKKENDDIATVLLAGASYNLIASSNTTLKFDDILTAKDTAGWENLSLKERAQHIKDPQRRRYVLDLLEKMWPTATKAENWKRFDNCQITQP